MKKRIYKDFMKGLSVAALARKYAKTKNEIEKAIRSELWENR